MNDGVPNQPSPSNPDPGQEKWISKAEVKALFPVNDRTLKYWSDEKKVRFKTVRNRTFYIESDVRAQFELYKRPKKFLGMRHSTVKRKIRAINYVLGMVILALGWAIFTGIDLTGPWWNIVMHNFFLALVLSIALIYGIVKLIQYIWKRNSGEIDPGKIGIAFPPF